jgi:hypothetical protein
VNGDQRGDFKFSICREDEIRVDYWNDSPGSNGIPQKRGRTLRGQKGIGMVLRRIAPGDSNRRECVGIRPLYGIRKKSDGGDWKNSYVSISRGSRVFFRSHLFGHYIMPDGDEFLDREETGLEIFKKEVGVMKRRGLIVVLVGFLFLVPSFAQSQPDRILKKLFEPKIHSGDLRVFQLEMNPDPVREGQWVSFQAVISNRSHYSARVSLFIKDKDEVVSAVDDVLLKPGNNRIFFSSDPLSIFQK